MANQSPYHPTIRELPEPQSPANPSGDSSMIEELRFDIEAAGIGSMLDTTPPPREWIVDDILPLDVTAMLAAGGGIGKSMSVLQLAVSIAIKCPWLGLKVGRCGSVLIISAEDDRDEMHRRLHRVVEHYQNEIVPRPGWNDAEQSLRGRLYVVDRVGEDNRLTSRSDGDLVRTKMADQIIATAHALPDVVLIVLDPLSRFDGGQPNDNSDGTRLVEAAEYIRRETGATVLIPHHVSKSSLRDPDAGQEAVRGATGLVDGVRWVGLLQALRKDKAKDYTVDPDEAGRYVRFTTPKMNYAAPWPGMWLERQAGGVLVPVELEPARMKRDKRRDEDRYTELLPKLLGLVEEEQKKGRPLTKRSLRDYAGKSGLFGVGDKTLRGIVARAVAESHIREHDTGDKRRGVELRTW